jgi:hypothetical protein
VHELGELGADVRGIQDRGDHLRHLLRRHRIDRDRLGQPRPLPDLNGSRERMGPVELVASIGGEQHHTASRQPPCGVVEQVTGRAVGPVDVVEHEQQPTITRPLLEQRDDRLEHAQLRLRRVARRRGRSAVPELREQLRQLRGHRPQAFPHLGEILRTELVPDRFYERQVGKRELNLGAASPQHAAAQLVGAACELVGEPRLADSGLPGHQDEASVTSIGREERVLELGQLVLPADE